MAGSYRAVGGLLQSINQRLLLLLLLLLATASALLLKAHLLHVQLLQLPLLLPELLWQQHLLLLVVWIHRSNLPLLQLQLQFLIHRLQCLPAPHWPICYPWCYLLLLA